MKGNHPQRPVIGFLSANIHIGASRVLWPGILDAAEIGNANLICFPGGRLDAAESAEARRNLIFRQIDTERLDGLVVWTSALAGVVTPQEIADFRQTYRPIPMVDLAASTGFGFNVTIDGNQGMRDLLLHLVEEHGYRRIALIRGPEGHPYAIERDQAYRQTLQAKGLVLDKQLISPALGWNKGAEAMSVLLDERGLQPGRDFQAVVAASDLLAIGAIRLMADRGIHVPTDVAVAGFNDIEEGRLVRPPLTSVSLPFYEQGRYSVEVLLARLEGREVPDETVLDSQLLVRQSCGCPSWSEKLAITGLTAVAPTSPPQLLKQTQARLAAEIFRVIHNRGIAATWAKQLLDAFRSEMKEGGNGRFRTTLAGMLQQGRLDGDETSAWQNTVSILRSCLLPTLTGGQRELAEALFGQARVVIGDAVQRAQIARQLQAERQSSLLRQIGQALITTFDVDRLADVLVEQLPALGIRSAYLALYENPEEPLATSRMVLAYSDNGRLDLGPNGRRYPSSQLLPAELLPDRRVTLLVEPLFFQEEPLGIAVFEVGPRDGDIYEVLRGHISSALKGALLFQESRNARLAAERADQIKTRLLANVSHELRTPLNIIIGHTQRLLDSPPAGLAEDLAHIQNSAAHQLRIINDLLDLSRAEINALDLYPVLLDPKALLAEAFNAFAQDAEKSGRVRWRLQLADQLPLIEADPVRLRQILLNLLSNAARFTAHGQITLGVEVKAPHLHLWVADTGIGVSPELAEHIYEPFVTQPHLNHPTGGIGLGLSITRHLVALHNGFMKLESRQGEGSVFHVYLPLPEPAEVLLPGGDQTGMSLWLITHAPEPPAEIAEFCQRRRLQLQIISPQDDFEPILTREPPAIVAWNMTTAVATDWSLVRRLHNHPDFSQVPFILYQPGTGDDLATGLTSLVVKPASKQALWQVLQPTLPAEAEGCIVIVDDDERARRLAYEAVSKGLPEYEILTAADGESGLQTILAQVPDLVILDLMMPEMDGFDVLDRLRADGRTRHVPVVILSGRQLSLQDVKRLEQHTAVLLQSKEIMSEDEIAAAFHRALFNTDTLPPQTSNLIKKAVAFLHQNYKHALTRREIAAELGLSEDYLTRAFSQELGVSPWDYLTRYRIAQAAERLQSTQDSVGRIGREVGFSDPAYFSRVFRKLKGVSPNEYRQQLK